jgi:hypothetical protein
VVPQTSHRLRLLSGGIFCLLLIAAAWPQAKTLEEVVGSIQEKSVRDTLMVLAGPEMQGRGTFSPGFDRAASFVEEQLKALGLEPAGKDGSYRLPYSLPCVTPAPESKVSWQGMPSGDDAPKLGADFVPMLGSPGGAVEAEAVFAGFGLQSKDDNWSDYKEKDVKGKIVFAFTREPWADDPKQKRFEGAAPSEASGLQEKARAAAAAGAVAIVFVPDPVLEPDEGLALLGSQLIPSGRGLSPTQVAAGMGYPSIPVMSVSRQLAGALFDKDLKAYHAEIEKKKKSTLLKSAAKLVRVEARHHIAPVETYNLAARLKGKSGSGEALVLGAHLDHVGWGVAQEQSQAKLEIFPGADDNASGSTALLEVAKALSGSEPEIDVLFLWFSAEELGLLGSTAYCEAPLYPMDKTVAMLNMDQIARTDPKEMNIGGAWERDDWAEFVRDQAKRAKTKLKIDFKAGRDLFARSDQYPFFQKQVPALFFFEGNIEANLVYHKPGDVAETIEFGKVTEVARVFAACAYAIAVEGVRLR